MSQKSHLSAVYFKNSALALLVGSFQDKTTLVAISSLPLKVLFKKLMKPGGFDLYLFVLGQWRMCDSS